MADELSTRDAKLIQYLNEAYGKEKELETALQAHIKMAKRPPYKKRLQDHLKETKAQAKGLESRIKALGGKAERSPVPVPGPQVAVEAATAVTAAATKALSAAKGPIHALRGTGEAEKQLKNAKTELWNEYEEIGNYTAIETLAESLNDAETAKLAREFRRQEERMANFLLKLIPTAHEGGRDRGGPGGRAAQAGGGLVVALSLALRRPRPRGGRRRRRGRAGRRGRPGRRGRAARRGPAVARRAPAGRRRAPAGRGRRERPRSAGWRGLLSAVVHGPAEPRRHRPRALGALRARRRGGRARARRRGRRLPAPARGRPRAARKRRRSARSSRTSSAAASRSRRASTRSSSAAARSSPAALSACTGPTACRRASTTGSSTSPTGGCGG